MKVGTEKTWRQHSEGSRDDAFANKIEESEDMKTKPLINYIVEDGKLPPGISE